MRKLAREDRRKIKLSAKRTSKRIKLHQIELLQTGVIKEVRTSFHTDPKHYGMVTEITTVPYSIGAINIGNRFY
jgi:hypothetical protein